MKKNIFANNFKKVFSVALTALLVMSGFFVANSALATEPLQPVNLGTAGDFVILTKSGISATVGTSIVGDIGVSPAAATYITGFGLIMDASECFSTTDPASLVTGRVYAADYNTGECTTPADLTIAVLNMQAAYTNAAGRAPTSAETTNVGAGTLTDLTLAPGVYEWGSAVNIPTNLTLNGSATDVWIFKVAGTLDIAADKQVLLIGGALPQNIFWQVSGAVTLGAGSHFEGIILAQTNIAMITGASINGRLLAQTAVTLQSNTVTAPEAAAPATVVILTLTADPTSPTITKSTSLITTTNQADIDTAIQSAIIGGLTPIAVTLENTGDADSANVRISSVNAGSHIQLWAIDTYDNWYDINITGWGPTSGFPVPAGYSVTTDVYAISDVVGEYDLTANLVDVTDPLVPVFITSTGGTITVVNAPVFIDTDADGILDEGEQSFNTIQAAVDAAVANDTIVVTAGEYTEQININKSLTILGSGSDTTHIVSPDPASMAIYDAFSSKSPTSSRYMGHRAADIPVVRIIASDVTFEGFHVNLDDQIFWNVNGSYGSNYSKGVGILVDHVETTPDTPDQFTEIIIQNNKIDGLLWDDYSDCIKVLASAVVDINNNILYGYGESAVSAQGMDTPRAAFYPTVTANDNTMYGGSGAREDNHFFFGIGYWSGATGLADGNTIYNAPNDNGYALNSWTPNPVSFTNNIILTDGGTVGGYGAQLYESSNLIFSGNDIQDQGLAGVIWLNPTLTITENTISNCIDGFLIDNQTSGSVAINNNSINGISAGHYAVKVGGTAEEDSGTIWGTWAGPSTIAIDATNNWWGAASGPAGGAISENVDYRPWLLEEDGDTYDQTVALTEVGQWALVSAPTLLSEVPTVINDGAGSVTLLAYEGGTFVTLGADNTKPVSAFYIQTTNKGGIGFNLAVISSPTNTSKQLTTGWNLVGTNYAGLAQDEFSSIQNTETAAGMVTLFVPDTYNSRKDVGYTSWGSDDANHDINANPITNLPGKDLSEYDGYWIFMNVAKAFVKQL